MLAPVVTASAPAPPATAITPGPLLLALDRNVTDVYRFMQRGDVDCSCLRRCSGVTSASLAAAPPSVAAGEAESPSYLHLARCARVIYRTVCVHAFFPPAGATDASA